MHDQSRFSDSGHCVTSRMWESSFVCLIVLLLCNNLLQRSAIEFRVNIGGSEIELVIVYIGASELELTILTV